MTYLQRSRENKNTFFRNLFFLVLLGVIINAFFSNPLSSFTRSVLSPLWRLKEAVFESNSLEAVARSQSSLVAENERLEDELARARLELLSYDELKKENTSLKDSLNALSGKEAVWARVIARPPISLYDTFVISHESDQIAVGQKVFAYGSVPVGEVAEVGKEVALVRLYSAPGNKFQVRLGEGEETVELIGTGGGNFKVRVPQSLSVSVGSKVFLPGSTNVLGIVEAVEEKPSDSFKSVFVRTPINIFKMTSVEVLI